MARTATFSSLLGAIGTTVLTGTFVVLLSFLAAKPLSAFWHAMVLIGLLGMWRYSWLLVNHVRSWIYRLYAFPRLRRKADATASPYPNRVFVVVASYHEEPEVSARVFGELVRELTKLPSRCTVVASVGSQDEADHIQSVVESYPGSDTIEVTYMHQHQGKRLALGHALRLVARKFREPQSWREREAANDIVVLLDGDTQLEPGALTRTLPFFRADPDLTAATTDEKALVVVNEPWLRHWYDLKFARRHVLMQSHALSHRVLTLTGRFSLYRAKDILSEAFIARLERDAIDHWLFGRIDFLMGDDKSTWYSLLSTGKKMLYIPDVSVTSVETRNEPVITLGLKLMRRWYGNMLRTNGRALRLGPAKVGGPFIWWSILDQRVAMWTTLVGPLSALFLGITTSATVVPLYLCWVLFTRMLVLWLLALQGLRVNIRHLPLFLFDQWAGAMIKVYALFHLDKQLWDKQALSKRSGHARNRIRWVANYQLLLSITCLVVVVGLLTGALQ